MSTSPLLVLASASPRRHEILNTIGLPHEIMVAPDPSGLDEPMRTGESPQDYVRRTAREKVLRTAALVKQRPDAGKQRESGNGAEHSGNGTEHLPYILGADTCVILDEEILGKPADIDDAAGMLKRLSGRTHTVRTAVAVW